MAVGYKHAIVACRLSRLSRVEGGQKDKSGLRSGQHVERSADSQEDCLCSLAQVNNIPDYHQLMRAEAPAAKVTVTDGHSDLRTSQTGRPNKRLLTARRGGREVL